MAAGEFVGYQGMAIGGGVVVVVVVVLERECCFLCASPHLRLGRRCNLDTPVRLTGLRQ